MAGSFGLVVASREQVDTDKSTGSEDIDMTWRAASVARLEAEAADARQSGQTPGACG